MIQVRIDLPPVPAPQRSHKRFLKWNAVDKAGNRVEQTIRAKETDAALFVHIDADSFDAAKFAAHLEFVSPRRQGGSPAKVSLEAGNISHTLLSVAAPEEEKPKPARKRSAKRETDKPAAPTRRGRGRSKKVKPEAEAPEPVVEDTPTESPEGETVVVEDNSVDATSEDAVE